MEYVGIDVHKVSSQVCILTEQGELIERRVRTERRRLTELFCERPHSRIVIEASTESEWVARCLEATGHEVIVADPNFAPMYATRQRKIKTDRRDANALCDASRLGAYRPAHRASDSSIRLRAEVAIRETLVNTRTKYISLIRSQLRRKGYRLPSGSVYSFEKRLEQAGISQELQTLIEPLLIVMRQINEQVKEADKTMEQTAKSDAVATRLKTMPGIGAITAVQFVAILDAVDRFDSAAQVRSYLGLVPRELSSGEKRFKGRITKAGNRRLRSLLVEAAWRISRSKDPSVEHLQKWFGRIALRRGKSIAAVALARKLAGILYAMWRDETEFAVPASNAQEVKAA